MRSVRTQAGTNAEFTPVSDHDESMQADVCREKEETHSLVYAYLDVARSFVAEPEVWSHDNATNAQLPMQNIFHESPRRKMPHRCEFDAALAKHALPGCVSLRQRCARLGERA